MLNNSSNLSVLLLKSAWVNSSVFCEGQRFFFVILLVHNSPECVRSTGFFSDTYHTKTILSARSSETLPTTYSQSLNGWWFHIISVLNLHSSALFTQVSSAVWRTHFLGSTTHDLLKETWGKRLRFISHWTLIGLSLTKLRLWSLHLTVDDGLIWCISG